MPAVPASPASSASSPVRKAMILAAGYGTRLGALTQLRPKPMLPLLGAPLVRWSVLWLRAQGVREIVINLHHLGEQIVAELGDGSALGVRIDYSDERGKILGTGGGLRQARPLLDEGSGAPILVLNGKIVFDLSLAELLATHRRLGAEATMVLRDDHEGVWGGSLAADAEGRLVTFLGETRAGAEPGAPSMFTGIQLLEASMLDRIPPEGEQCIVRTAYRAAFAEGATIAAHRARGYWWEHSTPERYLEGMRRILTGQAELAHREGPLQGVDPSAEVDPTARLREPYRIGPGARVGADAVVGPFVDLGAGARVDAGVRIEQAIVWPNASVHRDTRDAIVSGHTDR